MCISIMCLQYKRTVDANLNACVHAAAKTNNYIRIKFYPRFLSYSLARKQTEELRWMKRKQTNKNQNKKHLKA